MARKLGTNVELGYTIEIAASAVDQVEAYSGIQQLDGPVAIVGVRTQQEAGSAGFLKFDIELPGGGNQRMCRAIKSIAGENPQFIPTEWTDDISELGRWRLPFPIVWKKNEELRLHFSNSNGAAWDLTVYLDVVQISDADADAIRALGLLPTVLTARYALAASGSLSDEAGGRIQMLKDMGFLSYWLLNVSTSTFTMNAKLAAIERKQQAAVASGADTYDRSAKWFRQNVPNTFFTGTGTSKVRTPRQFCPNGDILALSSLDTSAAPNTVNHYFIGLGTLDLRDTPASIQKKLDDVYRLIGGADELEPL